MTPQDHEEQAREAIAMDEMTGCADRLAGWAASHEPISQALRIEIDRAAALLRRAHERKRVMREALQPFAALKPSSLYHDSEAYDPGYVLVLADHQCPDITREQLNAAKRALATLEADNG